MVLKSVSLLKITAQKDEIKRSISFPAGDEYKDGSSARTSEVSG